MKLQDQLITHSFIRGDSSYAGALSKSSGTHYVAQAAIKSRGRSLFQDQVGGGGFRGWIGPTGPTAASGCHHGHPCRTRAPLVPQSCQRHLCCDNRRRHIVATTRQALGYHWAERHCHHATNRNISTSRRPKCQGWNQQPPSASAADRRRRIPS